MERLILFLLRVQGSIEWLCLLLLLWCFGGESVFLKLAVWCVSGVDDDGIDSVGGVGGVRNGVWRLWNDCVLA